MVAVNSIIIIGAGAAGLAAARDLSRAGREVVVLEARDRVGGRVLTHREPRFPAPIELGAEFVHGRPHELCRLAHAANLQLYEVSERHWYFEGDKVSKSHEFWKQIEGLMDRMKRGESDQSLKQFLDTLPDDEETRQAKSMVTRYVEGFHAGNIDRIGIRGLIAANNAAESIDGDEAFRFVDGYGSLMDALRAEAESFGAKFHLRTTVRDLNWQSDQIEVICETGAAKGTCGFAAGAALITLPLAILQASAGNGAVRFVPALPQSKQKAIQGVAVGNVIKINLVFKQRFWESVKRWGEAGESVDFSDAGFFHCPGAPFPTWWTQLPIRAPLLVGWMGGPRAERVDTRQTAVSRTENPAGPVGPVFLDRAIASLAQIFNLSASAVGDEFESSFMHDWRDDPFSRGAYSYVPVNGLAAQRDLAEPLDSKLFFAGEATAAGHIGTVHGAIQSGERAAKEILESFG